MSKEKHELDFFGCLKQAPRKGNLFFSSGWASPFHNYYTNWRQLRVQSPTPNTKKWKHNPSDVGAQNQKKHVRQAVAVILPSLVVAI